MKEIVSITPQERDRLCRQLVEEMLQGHLDHREAVRRIGETVSMYHLAQIAADHAETDLPRSQKIARGTRIGMAWQRLTQTPGPAGRLGPGQPPVPFNRRETLKLHKRGFNAAQIAQRLGVSKSTVWRFLRNHQ